MAENNAPTGAFSRKTSLSTRCWRPHPRLVTLYLKQYTLNIQNSTTLRRLYHESWRAKYKVEHSCPLVDFTLRSLSLQSPRSKMSLSNINPKNSAEILDWNASLREPDPEPEDDNKSSTRRKVAAMGNNFKRYRHFRPLI